MSASSGGSSLTFPSQKDLSNYLQRLGPLYSQYAQKLWEYGVRSAAELANASVITLRKAGVSNDLHLDNIKATAAKGAQLGPLSQMSPDQLAALAQQVNQLNNNNTSGRATPSYANSYDGRKRMKLELSPSFVAAKVPPIPSSKIWMATEKEDQELLPRVMEMLRGLPGAEAITIKGRLAVKYNGMIIVDTHADNYLNGYKPDITLMADGYTLAIVAAYAVLELQVGCIDPGHKGKTEHYLMQMLDAIPGRQFAKGAVFNGEDVVLCEARRDAAGCTLHESLPLSMASGGKAAQHVWALFWSFLLSGGKHQDGVSLEEHYGWKPPQLRATRVDGRRTSARLQPDLLSVTKLVFTDGNVSVWLVALSGYNAPAVCKHCDPSQRRGSFERERQALQDIHTHDKPSAGEHKEGLQLWPQLLAVGDDVLVTQPFAQPLEGPTGVMTVARLRELVSGFWYLHRVLQRVHRDLEVKHVGLANGRLCVFDLSTCIRLAEDKRASSTYAGTIINASDDVLDQLSAEGTAQVTPHVKQDLVALVKTVYALTHKERLPVIAALAVGVAAELQRDAMAAAVSRVRSFWATEFSKDNPAGKRWQALVDAAHVTPQPTEDGTLYDQAITRLQESLSELVCPCV